MCPKGSAGHTKQHASVIALLRSFMILKDLRVPECKVAEKEKRGMCADGSHRRPSDLTVEDWDFVMAFLFMDVAGIDINTN